MPTDNQNPANPLPPEAPMMVTGGGKAKQKVNFKTIALIIGIFVLLGGIGTGYYLLQQNQDIRKRAQGGEEQCTVSQCPSDDDPNRLAECSDLDNTYNISVCSEERAGQIVTCDGEPFCCPYAGGDWTNDTTECGSSRTATPTATAKPTATATAASGATLTPTPTSTGSSGVKTPTPTPTPRKTGSTTTTATPAPIPESGVSTPTIVGLGLGALLLLVSLALAI